MKILPDQVILIGCGSIGEKYLAYIESTDIECVVADPRKDILSKKFRAKNDKISWIQDLSHAPEAFLNSTCVAIIANWGPDHFKTFSYLVLKGVKNFIIEKPIVSRMNQLVALEKIISKKKLNVVINQGWESNKYPESLINIFDSLNLGQLQMMVVHGGARCIATAGSHYIHVAQRLFRKEPKNVFANLQNNSINPRNQNLSYFQGSLCVEFSHDKYLSMNFSNQSSIEGEVNLYWKDAFATIIQNKIVIHKLPSEREYANIITRYSTPNIEVYNSFIVENNFESNFAVQTLFKKVLSGPRDNLLDLKLHLTSAKILLLGLISSDMQQKLFINHKSHMRYFWKDYKIS